MKCYAHYEMDAVSHCLDCGKAMCPECTQRFSMPICNGCNLGRIANDRQLLIKNSIWMAVLFLMGFFWDGRNGFAHSLLLGYLFAGIPWGWSALSRITPNVFLIMPLVGWGIYFLVKLVLSLMIGMFITPFKIVQVVNGLKEAKKLEEYTKQAV